MFFFGESIRIGRKHEIFFLLSMINIIYIWRVFIDSVFLSCWFAIFSWSPIISVYDIILIFLVFISVYIFIGSTYYYINQIRKNVDF